MMLLFCCRRLHDERGGDVLNEEGLMEVSRVLELKEQLHPRLTVESRARGMQAAQMIASWTTFRLDEHNDALLQTKMTQLQLGRQLAQQGQVLAGIYRVVANPDGTMLTVSGLEGFSH